METTEQKAPIGIDEPLLKVRNAIAVAQDKNLEITALAQGIATGELDEQQARYAVDGLSRLLRCLGEDLWSAQNAVEQARR
jgi:hypothetical protein